MCPPCTQHRRRWYRLQNTTGKTLDIAEKTSNISFLKATQFAVQWLRCISTEWWQFDDLFYALSWLLFPFYLVATIRTLKGNKNQYQVFVQNIIFSYFWNQGNQWRTPMKCATPTVRSAWWWWWWRQRSTLAFGAKFPVNFFRTALFCCKTNQIEVNRPPYCEAREDNLGCNCKRSCSSAVAIEKLTGGANDANKKRGWRKIGPALFDNVIIYSSNDPGSPPNSLFPYILPHTAMPTIHLTWPFTFAPHITPRPNLPHHLTPGSPQSNTNLTSSSWQDKTYCMHALSQ